MLSTKRVFTMWTRNFNWSFLIDICLYPVERSCVSGSSPLWHKHHCNVGWSFFPADIFTPRLLLRQFSRRGAFSYLYSVTCIVKRRDIMIFLIYECEYVLSLCRARVSLVLLQYSRYLSYLFNMLLTSWSRCSLLMKYFGRD